MIFIGNGLDVFVHFLGMETMELGEKASYGVGERVYLIFVYVACLGILDLRFMF